MGVRGEDVQTDYIIRWLNFNLHLATVVSVVKCHGDIIWYSR